MLRPPHAPRWRPGAPGDGLTPQRLAHGLLLFARDQSIEDAWEVHGLVVRVLATVDPSVGYNRRALLRRLCGLCN